MSDPVSALNGASFQGFATIREIGPVGMIALRAKGLKALDKAIKAAIGVKTPAQRRIEVNGDRACAWMSPDEYLLMLPYAEVAVALAKLSKSLAAEHYLAVDVSDARAVFRIEGDRAADVLRKLSPVDFDRLAPGEVRRTRAAQVAAALWKQDQGFTLVCFRSVAAYVMGLLTHSAQPGSEL
ncbi:sarcosine oxidase subunit gamma [Tabrizicola sp.]|jgi:sarcosine oxidase, subunit gamma|uniref:sarcosine oxidase subunit gamma n=1 Tax=Tabrizicola sp. TaxID=2005166 RepID=UPI0025FBDAE0|nr:sarcosine oxidase subunit gamma family protein [Tabrizicola sp.]MBY0352639.1 sarcosine oxidase subunit gamma [Tabrizicola sp.]MDK2775791.1 sarcosine oxidase subunit gamma [Tabrizicola sp.]